MKQISLFFAFLFFSTVALAQFRVPSIPDNASTPTRYRHVATVNGTQILSDTPGVNITTAWGDITGTAPTNIWWNLNGNSTVVSPVIIGGTVQFGSGVGGTKLSGFGIDISPSAGTPILVQNRDGGVQYILEGANSNYYVESESGFVFESETGPSIFTDQTGQKILEIYSDGANGIGFKIDENGKYNTRVTTGHNVSYEALGPDANHGFEWLTKGSGVYSFRGNSTQAARATFGEDTDNGSNFVTIKGPESQASDVVLTAGTTTGTIAIVSDVDAALALKAPLASPALTGTPTAPTATAGTNTTQIATTAYVDNLAITLPVTVPNGGLGVSSLTAYSLLAGGTTSTGNIQQISGVGTSGQSIVSNGAGALPTWQDYYWKILGTTTLSGVSTQTSNAASQHIFNGTWTATANNDAHIKISPSLTTRNTASDNLYGLTLNPTLNVHAGGPATTTLAGLFLNPTFSGTPLFNVMGLKSETTVVGTYQHSFRNLSSNAAAGTSIVFGNDAAAIIGIMNVGSSANTNFGTAGSLNLFSVGATANLVLGSGTAPRITLSPVGNLVTTQAAQSTSHTFTTHTQSAHTGGVPSGVLWTGGAHTAMTAGGSLVELNYNLNRTIQWASNTGVAIYKGVLFQAPTLAFASATGTVTNASTVHINGAPAVGTNAAITNAYALYVEAGMTRLGGGAQINGTITVPSLAGSGTDTRPVVLDALGVMSSPDDGVRTTVRTIATGQVLTSNGSPVVCVAAPGAGKVIDVISVGYYFDYNSIAYATNTTAFVGFSAHPLHTTAIPLNTTSDRYGKIVLDIGGDDAVATHANQDLYFTTSAGNPTAGNSPIKIYVTYRIITL
ncbi:MAG TPA: hypothetical protein VK508_01730 [Cyclobacteriaceae bacterium]|nr:hypothetical protein [Cyclobacteriaceae bacterium]